MDSFKWLLPLLLIWPAIQLIKILSIVRVLRALRFQVEPVERMPDAEVPAWFREAVEPLAAELRALGFTARFVSVKRSILGAAFDNPALVLLHSDGVIAASVRLHGSASREGAAYVSLHTVLANGRDLVTSSHRETEIVPLPPELDLETPSAASVAELLARHRERIEQARTAGASPRALVDESILERDRALGISAHAQLLESGQAEPAGPGRETLVLLWSAAFATARRILRAAPAEAKAAKNARALHAAPPLSESTRTEIEIRHYRQMLALQDLRFSWLPKAFFMLVSLAFFSLALRWTFTPGLGLVLIVALAFHEAGHLLGMRLFGYKDTQLLFLPFLGGVAVARDRLVLAPWKHLVILFLGPLPGIFVGAALLLWSGAEGAPAFVREAGILVLVFNAFNLLPVMPLDGGRIMDVALVSRFPRLRVVFLLFSGLGLIVIGFASASVLLKLLGVFALFRLPVEWTHAGIVKTLRKELPPAPGEDLVLRRLLGALREKCGAATGLVQRLQFVRGLEERIRRPRPGFGTMALAVGGFVAPLVLAVVLVFGVNIQRGERRVAEARARAAAAGLLEPVVPAPIQIEDAKNAALPLLELETLLARKWTPAALSAEEREQTLALLNEAAARPGFAPPAPDATEDAPAGFFGLRVAFATASLEARERLRYGDANAALDQGVRALSVLRHLRRDLRRWTYENDRTARMQLLSDIEEAFAQGARPTESQIETLLAATDEDALLAYAHAAQREARIAATRWFNETDSGEETSAAFNIFLHYLVRLSPEFFASQARHYDNTIALDAAFRAIRTGSWPAKKTVPPGAPGLSDPMDDNGGQTIASIDDWDEVEWELDLLGEDVAALRVARAGLALGKHLAEGRAMPAKAEDIRAPWAASPATHPRSDAPLSIAPRGEFLVLALPRASRAGVYSDGAVEHTWRVPPGSGASAAR
jgi:Zn-dependent proteases